MNELTGRYVNVVLAVEEGRGMEFLRNQVQIVANFNGRILESDLCVAEDCPLFNTELVWETEKKDLRKIRSSSIPLRVECFSIDSPQKRDRIGFALLSLRSANIIARDSNKEIPFLWQKLIGVPHEHKSSHPEVYLSLTIRDHLANEVPPSLPYVEEELPTPIPSEESIKIDQIPLRYMEDGFIQIGEEEANFQTFALNINMKLASNLDILLPEVLVFCQKKEKCYISIMLFGITVKTKPFMKDLHNNIIFNEKIVICLASNFKNLFDFFGGYEAIVAFHCGCDKLGLTKIPIKNLMPQLLPENKKDYYCSSKEECYFNFPSPNGIVPRGNDGRQPFIQVDAFLKQTLIQGKMPKVEVEREAPKTIMSKASGDQVPGNTPELPEMIKLNRKAHSAMEVSSQREAMKSTKSTDTLLRDVPPLIPPLEEASVEVETYQQYCLDVILENLTWKKAMSSENVSIKFLHPKASTSLVIKCEIDNDVDEHIILENVRCKMFFVSQVDQIKPLLSAWPGKVVLVDENEQILSEELELCTSMLTNKTDHTYISEWMALRSYEPLAKLGISLYLQEYGLKALPTTTGYELLPTILDEKIVVKELQDLLRWKDQQKGKFLEELRLMEGEQIEALKSDWEVKKNELESKLCRSVSKCKALSKELQVAANNIRINKSLEEKRANYEEDLKKRICKYSNCQDKELVVKISKVEQENEHLKEIINEQRQETQQIKKTALTKEQTTNLLQELRGLEEKFSNAQNAKTYFKEQWKTAVREIHELRTEDHKHYKDQLKIKKEELSQLSLEHFISGESSEIDQLSTGRSNRFDSPFTMMHN